jgi:uncharacterized membrane protein YGL010W
LVILSVAESLQDGSDEEEFSLAVLGWVVVGVGLAFFDDESHFFVDDDVEFSQFLGALFGFVYVLDYLFPLFVI